MELDEFERGVAHERQAVRARLIAKAEEERKMAGLFGVDAKQRIEAAVVLEMLAEEIDRGVL